MSEQPAAAPRMVLRSEGLVKRYKKRTVVKGASVDVTQGEVVGLLGPNGAGKTTTFYMITGMITPDDGRVFLDGAEITRLAMYKRARLGIGYLPQDPGYQRGFTVFEFVDYIAILKEWTVRGWAWPS